MEFDDILSFVSEENERLTQKYGVTDLEKKVLAQTVKLSEEVGELSEQILHRFSLQRKEKADRNDDADGRLAEEIADVIIVSLLIADRLDVDVHNALRKKMEKIRKRY